MTDNELTTGEELLSAFNDQPPKMDGYRTLSQFIDEALRNAFELGREAGHGMLQNEIALLKEDIEAFHTALDDLGVPRHENEMELSMYGRALRMPKPPEGGQ